MKPIRLLAFLAVVAIAALATAACGVSVGSDPTPGPTATAIPIDLITADPATDPDAFKASLTTDEAACFDEKVSAQAELQDQLQGSGIEGVDTAMLADKMGQLLPLTGLECYSESTAQRVYIGQVYRLAGGLSNDTLNCMVEHTNNSNITGLFSDDEAVQKDAMQADNLMSLVQSIFCLSPDERTALETNLASETAGARTGLIDGLECTFDYQDANGRFVAQDAITLLSSLADIGPDANTDTLPPQARELVASMFDLIPVTVECGLVTDEDLVDTGLTTDQLVCASNSLRDPIMALLDTLGTDNPESQMDFGVLADLFSALDKCGIDPNNIPGMDQALGGMGGALDPGTIAPELATPVAGQSMSLDDLEQFLSADQVSCLMDNITADDIQKLMDTGEPPTNMFAIMAECDITLDQFIEGF